MLGNLVRVLFALTAIAPLSISVAYVFAVKGQNLRWAFIAFCFCLLLGALALWIVGNASARLERLAAHAKLHVDNVQNFVAAANTVIRRKISLITQSGVLDNFTTEQIVGTAQAFNVQVQTTQEGKIVLPTNPTQLRRLLRFLDEDYYESPLSQTRFLSNSKRVAD